MRKLVSQMYRLIIPAFFLCFLLTSCGTDKQAAENMDSYQVYYVNKDGTAIQALEYQTASKDADVVIDELIEKMGENPVKPELKGAFGGKIAVLSHSLEEGQLILNLDGPYKEMDAVSEVLVRAAIVRTLTQVEGVSLVSLTIRQQPLTDSAGNIVGTMSDDMFIDNDENEINTYDKVTLHLYFANEAGDKLIETNRNVVYSSNISMEKLIVEQILKGPAESEEGVYPVANPDTKVIGVTVKDGTCYVNLDSGFLSQIYNVSSQVTLYAITNSLVEISNINKVQISIDGDTSITYRETTPLTTVFERNLDIVESN